MTIDTHGYFSFLARRTLTSDVLSCASLEEPLVCTCPNSKILSITDDMIQCEMATTTTPTPPSAQGSAAKSSSATALAAGASASCLCLVILLILFAYTRRKFVFAAAASNQGTLVPRHVLDKVGWWPNAKWKHRLFRLKQSVCVICRHACVCVSACMFLCVSVCSCAFVSVSVVCVSVSVWLFM